MFKNINHENRDKWLERNLSLLKKNDRILDAGAGELRYKKYCSHLDYVSQDFGEYEKNKINDGLKSSKWDTSKVDIICDITNIPVPDESFDAIMCIEVLEHLPEPMLALDEFQRILKPGGKLILTAPFSSNLHMAPYHFYTGFTKFWYEYHLDKRNFNINEITFNGDWHSLLRQEVSRLGSMERRLNNILWPLSYIFSLIFLLYFLIRGNKQDKNISCFGLFVIAEKL